MPSNQIGIRNNNAIVPYVAATKRTKEIDISTFIGSSVGSFSLRQVKAVFYADSNGSWRMTASGSLNYSSDTDLSGLATKYISFTGVVFRDATSGGMIASNSADVVQTVFTQFGTSNSNLYFIGSSSTIKFLRFTFEVSLASEPNWASLGTTAAAALEGVVAADVYIPEAKPGVNAGIVPAQGLDGRTDGATVPAGKVGQIIGDTLRSGTGGFTFTTSLSGGGSWGSGIPTTMGSVTLNKGVYLICINSAVTLANGLTRSFDLQLFIGGTNITPNYYYSNPVVNTGSADIGLVLPIVISSDSTTVLIKGRVTGGADTVAVYGEMSTVRIA